MRAKNCSIALSALTALALSGCKTIAPDVIEVPVPAPQEVRS